MVPMKKFLAVLLALVMAFSCMALAFAEDESSTEATEAAKGLNLTIDKTSFFDMTAADIIDSLIAVFDTHAEWWDAVEDIIVRLIDFIDSIGLGAVAQADVAGAISDLEAKLESLPIVGKVLEYCHNLINTLKQKIKDLYAGNRETEAVEETDAAPSADTGSSSMGIAAFAAISVAAAAAYVCTKKKAA